MAGYCQFYQLGVLSFSLFQTVSNVLARLEISALSNEQIAEIEAFCSEVREGLEYATFEDKQHYLELLDVHGTGRS